MSAQKQTAKKPVTKINLLPEKGFGSTTTGRILAWILSTFRVIVIVTEIIVMIAFLSRFWLDAQNTDLSEEITQKKAILTNSLSFDKEFKDVQKRLQIYSDYLNNKLSYSNYLEAIKSSQPGDVFLTSISFSEKRLILTGFSPSERSIEQFGVNLNSTDNFKGLKPTEIKSSLTQIGSLQFSFQADLN